MKRIVVSTFPNAKALPLWVAVAEGFFLARGLEVDIHETESSKVQRDLLASGGIHVAQAAVDNALSMITAGLDVVIVMGGENGMNDFIVQSDIASFEDLRGKTLVVDSPDTAYALLARKMLAQHGLTYEVDYKVNPVGNSGRRLAAMIASRDNAAGVLNPPFTAQAKAHGMKSLGRLVDHLGAYQAGGAFVLRPWAEANGDLLESYIAGYVEALRWLREDRNAATISRMLREKTLADARDRRGDAAGIGRAVVRLRHRRASRPARLRQCAGDAQCHRRRGSAPLRGQSARRRKLVRSRARAPRRRKADRLRWRQTNSPAATPSPSLSGISRGRRRRRS